VRRWGRAWRGAWLERGVRGPAAPHVADGLGRDAVPRRQRDAQAVRPPAAQVVGGRAGAVDGAGRLRRGEGFQRRDSAGNFVQEAVSVFERIKNRFEDAAVRRSRALGCRRRRSSSSSSSSKDSPLRRGRPSRPGARAGPAPGAPARRPRSRVRAAPRHLAHARCSYSRLHPSCSWALAAPCR